MFTCLLLVFLIELHTFMLAPPSTAQSPKNIPWTVLGQCNSCCKYCTGPRQGNKFDLEGPYHSVQDQLVITRPTPCNISCFTVKNIVIRDYIVICCLHVLYSSKNLLFTESFATCHHMLTAIFFNLFQDVVHNNGKNYISRDHNYSGIRKGFLMLYIACIFCVFALYPSFSCIMAQLHSVSSSYTSKSSRAIKFDILQTCRHLPPTSARNLDIKVIFDDG